MIREIPVIAISEKVAALVQTANFELGADVVRKLQEAYEVETSPIGKDIIRQILQNAEIARREHWPICQDTGYVVVYLEIGQDVHFSGGSVIDAVNEGVRQGYKAGYLRNSIALHPITDRRNSGDNTPAVIHFDLVPGDGVQITVLPKGGGSENMSCLRMLPPAAGRQGAVDFIVDCVDRAGANPCPPTIIGVGIGGTADKAMDIAKRAILRPVGEPHPDPDIAALEDEILARINRLGIGPQGLGGSVTSLAVHVETFPSHIASLPVAVNIQCHADRWQRARL